MEEFLSAEAARLGITKAELQRRLLDYYRESRESGLTCPHCDDEIAFDSALVGVGESANPDEPLSTHTDVVHTGSGGGNSSDRQDELEEQTQHNAERIQKMQQDLAKLGGTVEELSEEVDELRRERAELWSEINSLTEDLQSLDNWRRDTITSVNRTIGDVHRLAAVVFDNDPPCPDCENGTLEWDSGGFSSDAVRCTDCECYQEVSGL